MNARASKLIDIVVSHEGFYKIISSKRYNESYMGIDRKIFPRWSGWQIIDQWKPLKNGQHIEDDNLDDIVRRFYYNNFYTKLQIDSIINDLIAVHILDHAINAGVKNGIRVLQRAVNEMSTSAIRVNGIMNESVVDAINVLDNEELGEYVVMHRRKYYKNLASKSEKSAQFLKTNLKRVDKTTKALQPKLSTVIFNKLKSNGIIEKVLGWLFDWFKSKISKTTSL